MTNGYKPNFSQSALNLSGSHGFEIPTEKGHTGYANEVHEESAKVRKGIIGKEMDQCPWTKRIPPSMLPPSA